LPEIFVYSVAVLIYRIAGTTRVDVFQIICVPVFPTFVKTPGNITVKTKNTARLECAARGQPPPEIAWQKDGGNDFPAARERRMHVMPTDDVFFILNVKTVDMGTYSCTAQNQAGVIVANASLTVEGQSVDALYLLFLT
jgi:hypothetical protein